MKTSNFYNEGRTFSFSEIADQLGISEEELIKVAKEEGLLDENGKPTEFAIREELLTTESNIELN